MLQCVSSKPLLYLTCCPLPIHLFYQIYRLFLQNQSTPPPLLNHYYILFPQNHLLWETHQYFIEIRLKILLNMVGIWHFSLEICCNIPQYLQLPTIVKVLQQFSEIVVEIKPMDLHNDQSVILVVETLQFLIRLFVFLHLLLCQFESV